MDAFNNHLVKIVSRRWWFIPGAQYWGLIMAFVENRGWFAMMIELITKNNTIRDVFVVFLVVLM